MCLNAEKCIVYSNTKRISSRSEMCLDRQNFGWCFMNDILTKSNRKLCIENFIVCSARIKWEFLFLFDVSFLKLFDFQYGFNWEWQSIFDIYISTII